MQILHTHGDFISWLSTSETSQSLRFNDIITDFIFRLIIKKIIINEKESRIDQNADIFAKAR